jgi:ribonuclease BN (tRNA processing enzyme)
MIFNCAGTGSKGNCYCIRDPDGEILLLDCGLPKEKILRMVDYDLSKIAGCVVSHEHSDHYNRSSVRTLRKMGIPMVIPHKDICDCLKGENFVVRRFPVEHDVPCWGFYITNKHLGRILYITDTEYVRLNFKHLGVAYIIVECNYQKDLVNLDDPKMARVFQTHMEEQTCLDFIKANQTKNLGAVILIHMSRDGCDAEQAKNRIATEVNVPVYVAEPGKEIQI